MGNVSVQVKLPVEKLASLNSRVQQLRALVAKVEMDQEARLRETRNANPAEWRRMSAELEATRRCLLDMNVANLLRVYFSHGEETVDAMDAAGLVQLVSQHAARRGRPGLKDHRPEGFEPVKVARTAKADFSVVGKPKSARRAERRGGKAVR